jgi:hypothetical protein
MRRGEDDVFLFRKGLLLAVAGLFEPLPSSGAT